MKQSMEEPRPIASDGHLASIAGTHREWRPTGPLADDLAGVWMNALPQSARSLLQIVPDGCVDIIWTGVTLGVAGPDTRPVFESFPPGAVIVGVRFRPGAAPPWLGVPASEIVNGRLPLQEFWGAAARRLTDRLQGVRDPRHIGDLMLCALATRMPRPTLFDPAARAIAGAFAH